MTRSPDGTGTPLERDAVADLRRVNRDLIALSMLPATWQDSDPGWIIDDLARSLASMVGADFVGTTALDGTDNEGFRPAFTSSDVWDSPEVIEWMATRTAVIPPEADTGDVAAIDTRLGSVRVVLMPIGIKGNAQLAVASREPQFPTQSQRMLLRVGANLAAISIDRWRAETKEHRLAALVENSGDFIGVADLNGTPLYVNPTGLRLIGLHDTASIRRMHILDFAAPQERARMRDECWPLMTATGRWQGEMYLQNFRTGRGIPFLIDWFLIGDRRPDHPTVMATVSRDLTVQKQSEAELRQLSETLEQQVLVRTNQLTEANERLRNEAAERRLVNARLTRTPVGAAARRPA